MSMIPPDIGAASKQVCAQGRQSPLEKLTYLWLSRLLTKEREALAEVG